MTPPRAPKIDHTTVASQSKAAARFVDLSRLTVLESPDRDSLARMLILEGEQVLLGRATSAGDDLGLADPRLSRKHCAVIRSDGGWLLRDLGSTHGTRLDGSRILEHPLAHGSVVRIGDSLLLFEQLRFQTGTLLIPECAPLWGPSLELQILRGQIRKVAKEPLSVLILGETGTGKELAARALHEESGRKGPFIAVNCGALPAELVERELFGNLAGAFTGAGGDRMGLVEQANRGTLFLDEIGELPLDLQPKLLRMLAEREVRPLGSTRARPVDVRVVAATHADVEDSRILRPDLLARLRSWTLRVPPLRSRPVDILPLARRFSRGAPIQPDAAEALLLHPWPMNVRELEQAMNAARVDADGGEIGVEHLPPTLAASGSLGTETDSIPLELRVRRTGTPSASELAEVLDWYQGNIAQVASFFGRDRKQVYRWLERHQLERTPE